MCVFVGLCIICIALYIIRKDFYAESCLLTYLDCFEQKKSKTEWVIHVML